MKDKSLSLFLAYMQGRLATKETAAKHNTAYDIGALDELRALIWDAQQRLRVKESP